MRLIDADALIKVIQQNDYMLTAKHNSMAPGMFTSGIRQAVDESQTIDPVKQLEEQLADYHHMSELVNGKMAESARLRRINENLQEQLAASQRRERAAVEDLNKLAYVEARCEICKHYLDEDCVTCNFEWRGPQAGEGETP